MKPYSKKVRAEVRSWAGYHSKNLYVAYELLKLPSLYGPNPYKKTGKKIKSEEVFPNWPSVAKHSPCICTPCLGNKKLHKGISGEVYSAPLESPIPTNSISWTKDEDKAPDPSPGDKFLDVSTGDIYSQTSTNASSVVFSGGTSSVVVSGGVGGGGGAGSAWPNLEKFVAKYGGGAAKHGGVASSESSLKKLAASIVPSESIVPPKDVPAVYMQKEEKYPSYKVYFPKDLAVQQALSQKGYEAFIEGTDSALSGLKSVSYPIATSKPPSLILQIQSTSGNLLDSLSIPIQDFKAWKEDSGTTLKVTVPEGVLFAVQQALAQEALAPVAGEKIKLKKGDQVMVIANEDCQVALPKSTTQVPIRKKKEKPL